MKGIFFDKKEIIEEEKVIKNNLSIENEITGIKYFAEDKNGNIYKIQSESGIISENQDNIINLNNVKADLLLNNNNLIMITSKTANYNTGNFDTIFKTDVQILYNDYKINCDEITLLFSEKIVKISGNLLIKDLSTKFFADYMEIDLLTKKSKILMMDKNKKIKIIKNK
jgi:lipopolysaccharide assembly outer membrane protein LptD (OstA)